MQVDFVQALRDIGREKDIPLDTLREIIEAALVSAYKKHFGATCEIHVDIDWDNGTTQVFSRKRVVEHVENAHVEMALAEARRLDPTVEENEFLDIEVSPQALGRIAAQTAKQVVAQRIREAERDIIYEEFSNRDGDVVTGVAQRRDGRTVFVDLGRVEAVLPASEQSSLDNYRPGERLKVYILEVKRTTKIPRVLISRSHPGLLRKLFDLEVPEVHEGIVEIMAQAREAGARSKVAVASKQENVDPVGACVGHRGSRVQAVVDELRGEKVDIVRWSDKAEEYVASALSPAKVSRVMVDGETRSATVVAPDNQLSLAIGREGQNVRLAARLTGWRIDIRSEAQLAEEKEAAEAASGEGATPEPATAVAPEGLAPVAPASEADSAVMGEEAEETAPASVVSDQPEEAGQELVATEPQAIEQEEAAAETGEDGTVAVSAEEAPAEETGSEADVEPPVDADTTATEPVATETDTDAAQEPASEKVDEPEKETAGAPAGDTAAEGSTAPTPGEE